MWTWEYWAFNVPQGNTATMLITVDQAAGDTEADCDIYIKHNELPSHSVYDYRDVSLNGHMEQNVSNAKSGRYYIGIFAFKECAYTIKATLGNACPSNCNNRGLCNAFGVCECSGYWTGPDCGQQIPQLQLNTPVSSSVGAREWKMYRVNLPYTYSALSFTLQQTGPTQNTADLDLYLRRGSPPTIINFDYANGSLSHTSVISVTDAAAGDWFIGVWGYACPTSSCTFTLTASITDRCPNRCSLRGFCRGTACSCSSGFSGDYCETQTAPMQLGRAYTGYVESFAWNYFTFRALSSNPIRISVSPGEIRDGDCDLYVRKDERPTIFQYDYKDNTLQSDSVLDITNPADRNWHIGVYGYRRCDFHINITSISDSGRCRNGGVSTGSGGTCNCPAGWGGDLCEVRVLPLNPSSSYTGTVTSGAFVYYNFSVPETPTDLVVYLQETTPNSKGHVWIYLNQDYIPTVRDHSFEDIDTNTNYHMLKITRAQLPQRRTGRQNFIIGVYGTPYLLQGASAGYRLAAWAAPFH